LALPKKTVNVPLGGLYTKLPKTAGPVGRAETAINTYVTQLNPAQSPSILSPTGAEAQQSIGARNGFQVLEAPALQAPQGIGSLGNQIVAVDSLRGKLYSPTLSTWTTSTSVTFMPAQIRVGEAYSAVGTECTNPDSATINNVQLQLSVQSSVSSHLNFRIVDLATGTILTDWTPLYSGAAFAKTVADGSLFYVFYQPLNSTSIVVVTVTTAGVVSPTLTLPVTDSGAFVPWDIVYDSSVGVTWAGSTGPTQTYFIVINSLSPTSPPNVHQALGSALTTIGGCYFMQTRNQDGHVYLATQSTALPSHSPIVVYQWSPVSGITKTYAPWSPSEISFSHPVIQISGWVDQNGTVTLVASLFELLGDGTNTWAYNNLTQAASVTTAGSITTLNNQRAWSLASRVFPWQGNHYAILYYASCPITATTGASQPTYSIWCLETQQICGRFDYAFADKDEQTNIAGPNLSGAGHLSSVGFDLNDDAVCLLGYVTSSQAQDQVTFATAPSGTAAGVTFAAPPTVSILQTLSNAVSTGVHNLHVLDPVVPAVPVEYGGELTFPGPLPISLQGSTFSEVGFTLAPEQPFGLDPRTTNADIVPITLSENDTFQGSASQAITVSADGSDTVTNNSTVVVSTGTGMQPNSAGCVRGAEDGFPADVGFVEFTFANSAIPQWMQTMFTQVGATAAQAFLQSAFIGGSIVVSGFANGVNNGTFTIANHGFEGAAWRGIVWTGTPSLPISIVVTEIGTMVDEAAPAGASITFIPVFPGGWFFHNGVGGAGFDGSYIGGSLQITANPDVNNNGIFPVTAVEAPSLILQTTGVLDCQATISPTTKATFVPAQPYTFFFQNANFTSAYINGILTWTGAVHEDNSAQYRITAVIDSTHITVEPVNPGPTFNPTVFYNEQMDLLGLGSSQVSIFLVGNQLISGLTYGYVIVYERLDGNGNWVPSAWSVPMYVTLTGLQNAVTISDIPTYRCSENGGIISVYRSSFTTPAVKTPLADPGVYKKVTLNGAILNDPTVDAVTYLDQLSDLAAEFGQPLYNANADGGAVVPNDQPPALNSLAIYANRLMAIGYDDRIYTSKAKQDNFSVPWSLQFSQAIPDASSLTALAFTENACEVFSANGIWRTVGSPPDDTGENDSLNFQRSPFTIGCAGFVVTNKLGTIYSPPGGLKPWLVTRGVENQYIAAALEDIPAAGSILTGAVVNNLTVLQTLSGEMFVYDDIVGGWYDWQPTVGDTEVVQGFRWAAGPDGHATYAFLTTDGKVWFQRDATGDDDGVDIPVNYVLASLHMADINGFYRLKRFITYGTFVDPCTFVVTVDYNDAAQFPETRSLVLTTDPNPFEYGRKPAQQKCQAIRISYSWSGRGVTIEALTLEVAIKTGLNRISPTTRYF
jgi:hypothetical protein